MNPQDPKIIVAFYLRGDHLDPDQVTQLLKVQPTRAQLKGQKSRTSTGHEVIARIGLWSLEVVSTSVSLEDHLRQLGSALPSNVAWPSIVGVDEAYIDVFVAIGTDCDGEGSCNFELTPSVLQTLSEFGLPIRLTITAGPD